MSQQRIIDFRQDLDMHWIAELECGHAQHVRHDPPWQNFPWVLDQEDRAARIGTPLFCRRCEGEHHGDS